MWPFIEDPSGSNAPPPLEEPSPPPSPPPPILLIDKAVQKRDYEEALRLVVECPFACSESFPPGHASTRPSPAFPGGSPGMTLMHGVASNYHQVGDDPFSAVRLAWFFRTD